MSTAVTSAPGLKQERINLRLQEDVKKRLERAAGFEGKTIGHFILNSALAQAEKTIHSHEIMRLNEQDSAAFFDALNQPVCFNQKLTAAFVEHGQRVRSQ